MSTQPAVEPQIADVPEPKKPWYKKKRFIALGAVAAIAVIAVASGGGESASDSSAAGEQSETADAVYAMGSPIAADGLTVTLNSVETGVATVGQLDYAAQGTFTIYNVTVTNSSDKPVTIASNYLFEAEAANGSTYTPDLTGGYWASTDMVKADGYIDAINPGNSVTFNVVFDVPAGTELTKMTVHDSLNEPFSKGVTVTLA